MYKALDTVDEAWKIFTISNIAAATGHLLILYILIDALGWVISDVSFGFTGWGFGSCNIRPPRPNDPVGIDLMPTPILAAKLRIFHTKQMTAEMALFMGITLNFFFRQPIREANSLMTAEAFL